MVDVELEMERIGFWDLNSFQFICSSVPPNARILHKIYLLHPDHYNFSNICW